MDTFFKNLERRKVSVPQVLKRKALASGPRRPVASMAKAIIRLGSMGYSVYRTCVTYLYVRYGRTVNANLDLLRRSSLRRTSTQIRQFKVLFINLNLSKTNPSKQNIFLRLIPLTSTSKAYSPHKQIFLQLIVDGLFPIYYQRFISDTVTRDVTGR